MEVQINVHRHVYRKWYFFRRIVWHALLEHVDGTALMLGIGDTKEEAIKHLIEGGSKMGFMFDSDNPEVLAHLMTPRTTATE